MKLFLRKFLVYLITAVLVVPSWLVTSYLTADTAMAAEISTVNSGNIVEVADWNCVNCAQESSSGNDYLGMVLATSSLISPAMDFSSATNQVLNFKARTLNGVLASSSEITISVSSDGGLNWTIVETRTPSNNVLTQQLGINLSLYNSANVKVKLETLSAASNKGVGVDDVTITRTLPDTLASIAITTPATKLSYTVGDALDITGLVVTGTYSDGTTKVEAVLPSDVTGFDSAVAVTGQVLTVTVGGKTATYRIDITEKLAPTLENITVTTSATKLSYYIGEKTLDISGLVVTGVYSDKTTKVEKVELSDITGFNSDIAVTGQVLTITIDGKTTTYKIDIIADVTPPTIELRDSATQVLSVGSEYVAAQATVKDNLDVERKIDPTGTVDTTKAGTYFLQYDAIDAAGNKAIPAIVTVTVSKAAQAVATSGMTVTTPTEIVVPKGYAENMDIKVTTGGAVLNLAPSVTTGSDVAGIANKSAKMEGSTKISAEISSGNTVVVEMASGTTVTGPETWDGMVKLPEITVNPASVTVNSGNYPTSVASIEIGMPDVKLTFDKAVRILIPGGAGKSAGYTRSDVFTPISTVCTADTQDSGNLLPAEGDCKIDVGSDLVIWTKHFTKFVTYTQTLVIAPTFTATVVNKDSAKYLDINWKGTGADSYLIKVNDILISTITASVNDIDIAYNSSLKVLEGLKYTVSVISVKNNVQSINNIATTVDVPAAVAVPQPEVVVTPVTSAPAPTTSVAPAKAKAAAPEQKVETPKDADAGIVKGEDTNTEDANNWTPWIILFILIILAGAATGGYFYWFSDKAEVEVKVKDRAKGKIVEPVKTVAKQKETVKQAVEKAKPVAAAKPVQNAKPAQMASKKNHKKTKRW